MPLNRELTDRELTLRAYLEAKAQAEGLSLAFPTSLDSLAVVVALGLDSELRDERAVTQFVKDTQDHAKTEEISALRLRLAVLESTASSVVETKV